MATTENLDLEPGMPAPGNRMGSSAEKEWHDWKAGTKLPNDDEIREIISKSELNVVFIRTNGRLGWAFDDVRVPWGDTHASRAIDLLAQLQTTSLGKLNREALSLIGFSLSRALDEADHAKAEQSFDDAEEFVAQRRRQILEFYYLGAAVLSVIFTWVCTAMYYVIAAEDVLLRPFAVAAFFGATGGFLSVSHRFKKIEIRRFSSRSSVLLGGASRVVFGSLFGAVFLLFHKAGLILTVVGSNAWATASLSVVAGFSERLIPELIGAVESRVRLDAGDSDFNGSRKDDSRDDT